MRCACIDIGSNTTRLLVAESDDGSLREVLSRRTFARLCNPGAAIPPDTLTRIASEVAVQAKLAREAGAERITVVATAAIRDAANGDQLCAAIVAASGVDVSVLSADEEARLAFRGAVGTLERAPAGVIAVVDVGGGSTEIVCGTAADGVCWSASFRVGSALLADSYVHHDPPTADELGQIRDHVAGMFEDLEAPRADIAYAVGGSATSLRRLIGPALDDVALARGLEQLCAGRAEELAPRLGLHLARLRVLPAGMLVLGAVGRALGLPLAIANGGLREGVILDQQRGVAV